MAFSFDVEAVVNKIADLEDDISTPTPGVVTSYGYGANPQVITTQSLLPAVVHLIDGPVSTLGNATLEYTQHGWMLNFDIRSRLLILESIEDKYPSDESAAGTFWKSIAETFLNHANRVTLTSTGPALSYTCIFPARSFAVRNWPPVSTAPNAYWSLEYTHRFTITGS